MVSEKSRPEHGLEVIASAWQEAGVPNPQPSPPWQWRCDVPECNGMAFAELRTRLGQRFLCFRHYEELRQTAPPPERRRRGRPRR